MMADLGTFDEKMDAEQVARSRSLFGAALVTAVATVGQILAADEAMPPDEFRAGMYFAHLDVMASAIGGMADTTEDRTRFLEITTEQLRKLLVLEEPAHV